jgi:intracellular septation protein
MTGTGDPAPTPLPGALPESGAPLPSAGTREPAGWLRLLLDLGPVALFFAVNAFAGPFVGTGVFMVAMVASMIASRVMTGHIAALQWFSLVMVLSLGGLTLWLKDETFIKIKPTIYYLAISALLAVGLATGRHLLKLVLSSAYPGLSDTGWRQLTINWALFFVVMAGLNEVVWRNSSTDFWLGYKLWGATPLTLIFAMANVPMMRRHGLQLGQESADKSL